MDIIIVGGGKVGKTLCKELSEANHNITLVDQDEVLVDTMINKYDINGVVGNGANFDILHEVSVETCDIFIATTESDEVNIIASTIAKRLGAKHTVARVRNPEYANQFDLMKEALGISMMINPELSAARDIARSIRFASSLSVQTLAENRVSLVEIEVQEHSVLSNMPLTEFRQRFGSILVCIINRGGDVFIPSGNAVLQPLDKIFVAGLPKDMAHFNKGIKQPDKLIKSVMVVGGGKIAHYLLKLLEHNHMKVKVVEQDYDRCVALSQAHPNARVVNDDGTDPEVLDEQGIERYDAFVSLTGVDEENLMMSLYAAKRKVPKIITKMSRVNLLEVIDTKPLKRIVTPKDLVSNEIERYVRSRANAEGSNVEGLYRVADNKVEVLVFKVAENCEISDVPLAQMKLKNNLLIAYILRGKEVLFPNGQDRILPNDRVIVVTTHTNFSDLTDILDQE